MFNLIPRFIQEQVRQEQPRGVFEAATLFIDISGFVPMTQTLMQYGVDGAEWVSDLINRLFEPSITEVHRRGGVITGFAGDSFTAVFPLNQVDAAADACATAIRIKQIFEAQPIQSTPYGDFPFAVKVGLGQGDVEWGVLGPAEHCTFYFRGPGIETSILAEQRARPGDLIMHPELAALVPSRVARVTDAANFQVLDLTELSGLEIHEVGQDLPNLRPADLDQALVETFYPQLNQQDQSRGEFREAAIVFLALPENLDYAALNDLITIIIRMADQFGGYFLEIEFGDKGGLSVLYFGAPLSHENNIQRALDYLVALHDAARDVPWRAGVTHGTVYAGFIGAQARGRYGLLGDPVNFAARLIARSDTGQILVSEAIEQERGFRFSGLALGHFKGYAEPLQTAYFLGRRNADERVFPPQMFGVESVRAKLLDAAAPLLVGASAGTILLLGDPGVGKSHLAYLLRQSLESRASWFIGQTDQILRRPLSPYIYWLRHYFLYRPEAGAVDNRDSYLAKFNDLVGRIEGLLNADDLAYDDRSRAERTLQELHWAAPFLAALLNLSLPGSIFEQIENPRLRFQSTMTALRSLLRAEACIHTIEDAQGLDPASLEMLSYLHRGAANFPVLLLVLSRVGLDGNPPEFNIGEPERMTRIHLAALDPGSLRKMAQSFVGGQVTDELVRYLHDKTQANPLFVQQLLLQLQKEDLLRHNSAMDIWELIGQPEIQGRISSSLVARLDQLKPGDGS